MRNITKQKIWMRVLAVVLALALNLGAVDGLINGILGFAGMDTKVNSVSPAYADPGSGSFQPSVFDPNHDETSTLRFKFDYDHKTTVDLLKDGTLMKNLIDETTYKGKWHSEEDEDDEVPPRDIINYFTWNGKDGNGEPMDDGEYTVKLTPLYEYSEWPLDANVTIHQFPHTPTHDVFINYTTGQITIKGGADKNNKIIIYVNGVETATTMSDSTKQWQWSAFLDEGKIYTISADAENKWGTRCKQRSVPNRFEIYKFRKGDRLSNIADFYYYGDSRTNEKRQEYIVNNTGLPDYYVQTDWFLLLKDPTKEAIYSPYTDPASLPNATDITGGDFEFCESSGEPVNPATGNYFSIKTDLSISGKGLPLQFTRTYNNQREYKGALGWGWDFTYNQKLDFFGNGQIGYQRGDGSVEYFTPDGQGGYTPPEGYYEVLVKNQDRSYTLQTKDKVTYLFDYTGQLARINDRNGNAVKLNYNEADLLTSILDASGHSLRLSYDDQRRIKTITDNLGRTVVYEYNGAGDLISVTDVRGGKTVYEYNDKHWLLKATDPKNYLIVENKYNSLGQVENQKDAEGNVFYFSYNAVTKRTVCKNNRGIETEFEYDDNHRQTRKITSGQTRLVTTYDSKGNLEAVADPAGNRTIFEYDDRGNLLSAVNKANKWTLFKYDQQDNLVEITDPLQNKTKFEYDGKGNITKITDAAGQATTIHYNTNGQPAEIVDARGVTNKMG